MHFLNSLSAHLGHVLAQYGGWGLLAINFLDSSFLAFPLINDLLLIHMASHNHRAALIYAVQSTVGSVLGAYVIYGIAQGGRHVLFRKRSESRVTGARHWLERNDFLTVLVASVLPPPAPFKLFPVAAGALRMKAGRFVGALIVGRGIRFVAEALIGVEYGTGAEAYLRAHLASASALTIIFIVAATIAYRWLVSQV